jgi:hypothetical protein
MIIKHSLSGWQLDAQFTGTGLPCSVIGVPSLHELLIALGMLAQDMLMKLAKQTNGAVVGPLACS